MTILQISLVFSLLKFLFSYILYVRFDRIFKLHTLNHEYFVSKIIFSESRSINIEELIHAFRFLPISSAYRVFHLFQAILLLLLLSLFNNGRVPLGLFLDFLFAGSIVVKGKMPIFPSKMTSPFSAKCGLHTTHINITFVMNRFDLPDLYGSASSDSRYSTLNLEFCFCPYSLGCLPANSKLCCCLLNSSIWYFFCLAPLQQSLS
ncbi:uncharacterized protein LOC121769432 [Salvia splendens]|uniref:uncharacterized protein LOC121769432 n=1 Tax=Salvia splendens TaxID=180675 RepID=UPI001C2605A1|nr:uncharacterized protein LOC121769432 [Salvia splendens]